MNNKVLGGKVIDQDTAYELLEALKFHHRHEHVPVSIIGERRGCETCQLIAKAEGK